MGASPSKPESQPQQHQHQQPRPHQQPEPQPQQQPQQGDANKSSTNSSTKEAQLEFPHNYERILEDADSPVDKSSREKLCGQLYAGVFLNHKTKKYWVEKKSNSNCFELYARALKITWAEDQNYWKWVQHKESGTMVEVAELKRVCWLEVHGHLDTTKLSPGVSYQVSFEIMLKDLAQGWEHPVNVILVLPVAGGKKQLQRRKENFMVQKRACWIEIPVGEFVASDKDVGKMEITMYEYGGMWKQGLVIKGVAIKPKDKENITTIQTLV